MDKVWVIETGDYEERYVFGVAASVEAAVGLVKRTYSKYAVSWSELVERGDCHVLRGQFSAVRGLSTQHEAEYTLTPQFVASLVDA